MSERKSKVRINYLVWRIGERKPKEEHIPDQCQEV